MAGNHNSGRKKTPKGNHSTAAITAWMTPNEKKLIKAAAATVRTPVGRWLGNVGIERARQMLGITTEK